MMKRNTQSNSLKRELNVSDATLMGLAWVYYEVYQSFERDHLGAHAFLYAYRDNIENGYIC